MKKAALHNLGCKVNSYECEAMGALLSAAGYEIVPFSEKADVYVINTCTVTNTASHKSRQMIHRARTQNPDAVVVAAGCWTQLSEDEARGDGAIDVIIGNNEKARLVEMIEGAKRGKKSVLIDDINKPHVPFEKLEGGAPRGRVRAFLKIQDGCNRFCTYCAIPYARGRARSADPGGVLSEARRLADAGYREIVISGIHICSYGSEWEKNGYPEYTEKWKLGGAPLEPLLFLIRDISEIPGIERIRLGSLEPGMITEEFVKGLKETGKVCPHFHLSLQSGSRSVLSRMNRHYTPAEFSRKAELIRNAYTAPALTTDIIVGFPGETEAEFDETLRFAREIGFYEIHVFPYSKREGTAACRISGHVSEKIKKERARRLIHEAGRLKEKYIAEFYGRSLEVLFEGRVPGKKNVYRGFSREYILVEKEYSEDVTGKLMDVVFSRHLY